MGKAFLLEKFKNGDLTVESNRLDFILIVNELYLLNI